MVEVLVVQDVVHPGQIAEAGFGDRIDQGSVRAARQCGKVERQQGSAAGAREIAHRLHQLIGGLGVDLVRQHQAGVGQGATCTQAQELGIGDGRHADAHFAGGILPGHDSGILVIDAVGHQQKQQARIGRRQAHGSLDRLVGGAVRRRRCRAVPGIALRHAGDGALWIGGLRIGASAAADQTHAQQQRREPSHRSRPEPA